MSIIKPPLKAKAEALVRKTAARCRKILLRKSSPLEVSRTWNPEIKISWSGHRTMSRGSAKRISMALGHLIPSFPGQNCVFHEYVTIQNEPAIGSFLSPDWRDKIVAVTAHEMAHSAQYAPVTRDRTWKDLYGKPHGQGWRRLYAYLRHELGLNEKIRATGGVIGADKIRGLSDSLSNLDPRFDFRHDAKRRIHLVLSKGEFRLRPRVLRRSHETLCRGEVAWNLDPPVGSISSMCWNCLAIYQQLITRKEKHVRSVSSSARA